MRNSRREEREEAAAATEASSHPSPLYCLKHAPQRRANGLVRLGYSQVSWLAEAHEGSEDLSAETLRLQL